MARKRKNDVTSQSNNSINDWNKRLGYSEASLKALESGTYGKTTNRKPQSTRSEGQAKIANPTPVPALDGMLGTSKKTKWESNLSKNKTGNIDTERARRNYADSIGYEPKSNDQNYVVKRDRYDKLMQDNRLANDIKTLAQINYKNSNQDATVSQEWADEYGAKNITGGLNKSQFIKQLSHRYELTPEELNDMALTFHTDANNADVEQYGKRLEEVGEAHPVVGSAGSLVGTVGSGIEGMYNTVVGGITNDDRYLSNMFRTTKNSPREGVKKNINSEGGKLGYDVLMGVGDMAAGAATGSAPVILAGNTANEAQASARERGSSTRKASIYGAGAGALDYITNKIGLDKAKQLATESIKSTGIKKFLTQNAVAGLGEAGENVLQDLGQSLIDALVNGKNAELSQSFDNKIASGMNESDAFKAVAKEYATSLATSAGVGFGMGSAMQGGASILPKLPELVSNNKSVSEAPISSKLANISDDIFLKDADIDDYLHSGKSFHKNRYNAMTNGENIIVRSVAELRNKVNSILNSKNPSSMQPVGVMRVGQNIADQLKALDDSVDASNYFFEINPSDLKHTYNKHYVPELDSKYDDLPMDSDDVVYAISHFNDGIVNKVRTRNDGRKSAEMTIPADDGDYFAVQIISKGDGALALKTLVKKNKGNVDTVGDNNNPSATHSHITSDLNINPIEQKVNSGTANEAAGWTNPRLIKKLEGAELAEAQAQIKSNNSKIEALKTEIEALKNDPKNMYRGNLKKAVQKEIYNREKQMRELQKVNKGLDQQVKGGLKPVLDMLSKEQKNLIYDTSGKYDSVFSQINFAAKFAGDTPEAKALATKAQKAIREYVKTGSSKSLKDMTDSLTELDNMAKTVNASWKSSQGNEWNYEKAFGDQAQYLYNLQPVADIYNAEKAAAKAANSESITPVETENAGGGNIPPNEPPTPPKTDISRRYETLKKSDLFTKSEANMKMLETAKEQGVFNKDVESRKKSQEAALKEYLNDEEATMRKNFEEDWQGGKDVDTAMLILHDALDSNSQAWTNMALLKQAIQTKKAGRILRAARDYAYSGTKEGTLSKVGDYLVDKAEKVLANKKMGSEYKSMAESIKKGDYAILAKLDMDEANVNRIREAIANGASENDIATMLAMYKAVGTTGVSQETLDQVSQLYEQIEKLPPTSKARADLEADVFKVLAKDVGGKRTWREQWDAWRYLAMLGNPKTHLRNVLGNLTHRMVTETKDVIGAVIEEAVDKANRATGGQGIERTKALLGANDKNLVDLARKDADDVAYTSLNDTGNKYNVKNEISRARDSFNNKTLSKIDEFNSNMLDLEDYNALKSKYSKSLSRFLKANGADESIFSATDDASKALLEKGRAYAVDQAKQATFHEYSKLAEALTQFSQKMQEDSKLSHKAAGYVLEGLVPFKKTPINILKQGAKYSPIELVKSIGKMYKAVKGGESASDAIESLASGLTGSGIYALGAFLASQGLLTGSRDENYTVDNAETEQGSQNYALKIGDNSYTLDWLAPMSLPLFAGVETYNYLQKRRNGDDTDVFDAVVDGLSTIAEPITEMSMLQGINNTLESLSYSGLKSAIGTFGTSALTGYLTQGVPTLAGQFARAIDGTRRSTYTDKDNAAKRQIDKAITKVENKLPFVSQTNEPYVDSRGQVQQNEGLFSSLLGNNFGTRLADQMLSPGYYKQGTVTDVDNELNRLYKETGTSVYRKVSSGKIGENRLSKEDFTKYQSLLGKTTDNLYDTIIHSDTYNNLDNDAKVKMLQSAEDIAKNLADSEIGGKTLDKSAQKLVDIYKNEGDEGVLNYLADDVAAKALDLSHDTYVKKEAEKPGGATEYAEYKEKAKQLGLSTDTYIKQEQNNPNGAEGYAQDKQEAIEYGFVDKNGKPKTEAYEKARALYGDDDAAIRKSQEFYANGIKKAGDKLPELINDNSLSNDAKGKLLVGDANSLTGTKKQMFDMGGYEGAYYYYLVKNFADADGNGNVKKAEREAYFAGDSQYLDDLWALNQDMYMYLMNNLK